MYGIFHLSRNRNRIRRRPEKEIFRIGERLVPRWQHCTRQYGKWVQGDGETVLIFYPTYERCVFRMFSLLFVFSRSRLLTIAARCIL